MSKLIRYSGLFFIRAWMFLLANLFAASIASAAQVVLVFDNSLAGATSLQPLTRSQMLIRNLKTVNVTQAAFLIDTYDIDRKDEERLALYSDAGHLLVNTGHNDFLMSKKNIFRMEVNLLKAEAYLLPYFGYKKHVHIDWLNETYDQQSRRDLIKFLDEHEFRPAFSGITYLRAADEYVNQLYQMRKKLGKSVNMEKLQKAYVELLVKDMQLQDAYASFTLGYSPIHILTLQENDLAAYFIIPLVDELNSKGWQIIPAEKAFSDPVANTYGFFRYEANSYWKSVAPFIADQVSYPRLIGNRQPMVDQVLRKYIPELLQ
jgi:hypothetical protein